MNGFMACHGFGLLFLSGAVLGLCVVVAGAWPTLPLVIVPLILGGVGDRLDYLSVGPLRIQLRPIAVRRDLALRAWPVRRKGSRARSATLAEIERPGP